MATNPKISLVKGGKTVDGAFIPKNASTSADVLNTSTLAPAVPFSFTPPKPATSISGLGGYLEAAATQGASDLAARTEAERQSAAAVRDASLDLYSNALINQQGESQFTADAYKPEVDPLQRELDDINQQILQEQHGLRRQLERLDKNEGGLFSGAVQDEKNRVERESISKQADLYVIQQGVQGRFDSAKAIADRQVDAKLEQQKNLIDALKLNYETNRDLFTTADQRAFDVVLADRQNALEDERTRLKEISDLSLAALQAGAPPAVAAQMRSAKTVEEAISMGGAYLGPKPATPEAPKLQNFGTSDNPIWKQYNTTTGMWEDVSGLTQSQETDPLLQAQAVQTVSQVDEVLNNRALRTAVGTTPLARGSGGFGSFLKSFTVAGAPNGLNAVWNRLTGSQQRFIAGVNQVTQQLTLDKLIQSKSAGATFGSLTEGEKKTLAESASKVNSWAIKDDEDRVIGYDIDEATFSKEMDTIKYFSALDALKKGVAPEQIGAQVLTDNTIWIRNSDGTFSQLQ